MKFEYQNYGDIIYRVDNFWFRYNNQHGADIKILDFLTENEYAYQFEIDKNIEVPTRLRISSSADSTLLKEFNLDPKSVFTTKQEALQHAIHFVSTILDQHSSISSKKINKIN